MSSSKSRRALITGATSGLGRETAKRLAARGYHVILAGRSIDAGTDAVGEISASGGSAEFRELDLADLSRIRTLAKSACASGAALDVLVNNAGILPPKERATTKDGFELEFGIAYLGHFALTGLLLPALLRAKAPRVVSVSSLSHPGGRIALDDLNCERGYNATQSYASTKLACLMFALELQRRASAAGSSLISLAAHPGIARTALASGWEHEDRRRLLDRLELMSFHVFMRLFGVSAEVGARSLVMAASGQVEPGGYYGPTRFAQTTGRPGRVKPHRKARDRTVASALWERSERMTGVRYADQWSAR